MIEIVLTLCLISDPATCREERRAFDGPLIAYAMAGQFEGAAYVASHPKWRLAGWRCGPKAREA